MNFFIKHKQVFLGMIAGAIVGYLYFYFVGCESGSCSITSKPLNSSIYGSLIGGLFVNVFQKESQKNKSE